MPMKDKLADQLARLGMNDRDPDDRDDRVYSGDDMSAILGDGETLDVTVPPEEPPLPSGFDFYVDEMGELQEGFEPFEDDPETSDDHYTNLALQLSQHDLNRIASDLIEQVDADDDAREDWKDRFRRGLELMGILKDEIDDGPFPGASSSVHPLLVEACTQFWARSFGEIFPPAGPCKAKVVGAQSIEKNQAAQRIEEFHNWSLTSDDRGYYRESSRMLWRLPMTGSAYRKTFFDPLLGRITAKVIEPEDLIICAAAKSLEDAPRFTHRYTKTTNELRKLMGARIYRKIPLETTDGVEHDDIELARAETVDIDKSAKSDVTADDSRRLYEIYVELDLPGYEDTDETDQPTGIELPYIVTIDVETQEILAIYRNWSPEDPLRRRENYISSYEYIPGHGPYGYGLLHLIGGLQEAATGALRALLDSAATASIPGGFVAKDANIRDDKLIFEPGVWKPVEATAEEFSKAFLTPPAKEPSPALFQLLGFLTQAAEKFTSTTEIQTGQTNQNMPVGTTMALMEAGNRVQSTIHQGLHTSVSHELRIRHEIAKANLTDDGYPYEVGGDPRQVMAADFNFGVSIVPVSDPNIFSSAQRISMAQTAWQLANQRPDIFNVREAAVRMLDAIRMPNAETLIVPEVAPMPYDPAGEIQAILMGKPVLVTPDQPHAAYLQHHAAFLQNPQFGGNQQVLQQVGPAIMAVIGQHMAYAWQQGVMSAGMPTAPIDPQSGQPMIPQQPMPPQVMAQMMGQIAPQLAQIAGLPGGAAPGQTGMDPMKQAERQQELAHADAKFQQEMQQRQAEHQLKMSQTIEEMVAKLRANQQQQALAAQAKAQDMQIDRVQAAAKIEQQRVIDSLKARDRRDDAMMRDANRKLDLTTHIDRTEYDRLARQVDDERRRRNEDLDFVRMG